MHDMDPMRLTEDEILDELRCAAARGYPMTARQILKFNPLSIRRLIDGFRVMTRSTRHGEVVYLPSTGVWGQPEKRHEPMPPEIRKRPRPEIIRTRASLKPVQLPAVKKPNNSMLNRQWRLYELDYVTIRLQEGWTMAAIARRMPLRTYEAVRSIVKEYKLRCR